MARKNTYGKYILSAGEIGSYVVCPEAWRLSKVSQVRPIHTETVEQGNQLHKEWSKSVDEAMYFTKSVKLILTMTILAIMFFLIRFVWG